MTSKSLKFILFLLFPTVFLAAPQILQAKIYRYIDENGRYVFVNDESKIPAHYQGDLKTYREELDHLSAAEKHLVLEERRQKREEKELLRRKAISEAAKREYLGSLETRVFIKGNQVMVPVQVAMGRQKVDTLLLLDTGASHTVFHRNALEGLNMEKGKKQYARTASGEIMESRQINFDYIKVGPFKNENVAAMVIELKGPAPAFGGLLGMDFLRNRDYKIDYHKQVIRWGH